MASDEVDDQHNSEDCSHSELKDGSAVNMKGGIIMTEINFKSVKIENVKEKFGDMSTYGCLQSVFKDKPVGVLDSHSQGSNVYIDSKGKRHFIVSHDSQINLDTRGYLIIFSEPLYERMEPMTIRPDAGAYNHPGSFQIVGDYLFLPIEYYRWGIIKKDGCKVFVYNLSPLSEGKEPTLVCETAFDNHRAGMLGVTSEWLAIADGKITYLYHIDSFDGASLNLTSYGSKEINDFQGIGLITGKEMDGDKEVEKLYMIGLRFKDSGNMDFIDLYELKPKSQKEFECEYNGELHVTTDHGRGTGGSGGIHFRFGGGVYLTENSIVCLGTGRNFIEGTEFNFNTFSNTDRLEINCKQSPLQGQNNRCSRNFSLKGFQERNNKGSKKVKFTIMKNGEPADNITINVAQDRSGTDKKIYENITNESEPFKLSTESPLYFFYDPDFKPKTNDSLIVVIEGTN